MLELTTTVSWGIWEQSTAQKVQRPRAASLKGQFHRARVATLSVASRSDHAAVTGIMDRFPGPRGQSDCSRFARLQDTHVKSPAVSGVFLPYSRAVGCALSRWAADWTGPIRDASCAETKASATKCAYLRFCQHSTLSRRIRILIFLAPPISWETHREN